MRCSECSAEIKPVVAFDVDGTLGDYHGQLIEFAKLYLNREPHPNNGYDGVMNFGDWMIDTFDMDGRKEYRDIKLAFRQGGSKRWMPPYPEMIEAVRFAKEGLGCEVWLTTTRPYLRLDSVDPDTREWLRRNEVPFDHLMYDDHKYELLVKYIDPRRIVAIVDDLPEQLAEADAVFNQGCPIKCPTILVRKGFNTGVEWDGPEVYEGNSLKKILRERVDKWLRISRRLTDQSMTRSTTRSSQMSSSGS